MQRSIPLAFLAAALLSAAPIALDRAAAPGVSLATAEAAASVDINVFFTSLSPYGSWIPSTDYNYVWVPGQVDADWSPYTNGHWVYTDQYGWYFASDEPFASIVYHYGRWGYDPVIGWYWVPGTNWAPAWVAWRQGGDDIGWAPLPPQGNGYATDVNITINIGQVPDHYWRFVPSNQFLAPQLRTVDFGGDKRPDIYRSTQPSGFVNVQNNVVVNNVITLNFIEQQTKQKVTPSRINAVNDPKQAGPGGNNSGGNNGNNGANNGNNNGGSINAFIASIAPPDKTVTPPKVTDRTAIQAPTKGQSDQPSNPQEKGGPQVGALGPAGGNGSGPTGNGPNGPNGNGPNGPGANGNGPGGPGNGPNGNGSNGPAVGSTGPGNTACPQDTDPKTPGCQPPKTPEGTGKPSVTPQVGALPGNPAGPTGPGGDKGDKGTSGAGPQSPGSAAVTPKDTGPTVTPPSGPAATGTAACPGDTDLKAPGCQRADTGNGNGIGPKTDNTGPAAGGGNATNGPGAGGGNADNGPGKGGGTATTNGPSGGSADNGPGKGGPAGAGNNGGGKQPTDNSVAQGNGPGNGASGPGKGGPAVAAPGGGDNGKCVDTDPKTPGCQPATNPGGGPGKP